MGLFSKKSSAPSQEEDVLNAEDEILGCLDEVVRRKLRITLKRGREEGDVFPGYLDPKGGLLQLLGSHGAPVNEEFTCGFSLDATWFVFRSKLVQREGNVGLVIPSLITRQERRQSRRVVFSPREEIKVTILEGLGTGRGVFGIANDICEGGMCLTVSKAMALEDERVITPSSTLFDAGAPLMLVKINRLPGRPVIETEAAVNRMFLDGKWKMAIEFRGLPRPALDSISQLVESRSMPFKLIRRSYKKRILQQKNEADPTPPGAGGRVAQDSGAGPQKERISVENETPLVEDAKTVQGTAIEVPPAQPAPMGIVVLVYGDALLQKLAFLNPAESSGYSVITEEKPLGLMKALRELGPKYFLCEAAMKDKRIFDFLQPWHAMGILENVAVAVCGNDVNTKERLKAKMLNVKTVVDLDSVTEGWVREFLADRES